MRLAVEPSHRRDLDPFGAREPAPGLGAARFARRARSDAHHAQPRPADRLRPGEPDRRLVVTADLGERRRDQPQSPPLPARLERQALLGDRPPHSRQRRVRRREEAHAARFGRGQQRAAHRAARADANGRARAGRTSPEPRARRAPALPLPLRPTRDSRADAARRPGAPAGRRPLPGSDRWRRASRAPPRAPGAAGGAPGHLLPAGNRAGRGRARLRRPPPERRAGRAPGRRPAGAPQRRRGSARGHTPRPPRSRFRPAARRRTRPAGSGAPAASSAAARAADKRASDSASENAGLTWECSPSSGRGR